jgi:hypothetical protein
MHVRSGTRTAAAAGAPASAATISKTTVRIHRVAGAFDMAAA